jgi:taurine dioxygenase
VEGLDLAKPLNVEQFKEIHPARLKRQAIFFEDQHITPVQHRDFAGRSSPA